MAVIAYLNSFPAPNALEYLAGFPEHEVVRVDGTQKLELCFSTIERAHAWQCVGARDEVPDGLLVDADFLSRAPNLLICSASGSGVDVFDLDACNAAGVVVVNQAGANAQSVAEHAVGMMISLHKHIGRADRLLRQGWNGPRSEFFGVDLHRRTVGIVGFGHIGRRTAQICASGFGCDVIACDPYVDDVEMNSHNVRKVNFDALLRQSDIISVHTPLTSETRQLFDASAFARMKKGACFVITARGEIHDEEALADALESGHIAAAGLDVWAVEPPPPGHRLVQHPNVLSTPHVAGGTWNSLTNMAAYAAEQIVELLAGNPPPRPVNPEVLPVYYKRLRELDVA